MGLYTVPYRSGAAAPSLPLRGRLLGRIRWGYWRKLGAVLLTASAGFPFARKCCLELILQEKMCPVAKMFTPRKQMVFRSPWVGEKTNLMQDAEKMNPWSSCRHIPLRIGFPKKSGCFRIKSEENPGKRHRFPTIRGIAQKRFQSGKDIRQTRQLLEKSPRKRKKLLLPQNNCVIVQSILTKRSPGFCAGLKRKITCAGFEVQNGKIAKNKCPSWRYKW